MEVSSVIIQKTKPISDEGNNNNTTTFTQNIIMGNDISNALNDAGEAIGGAVTSAGEAIGDAVTSYVSIRNNVEKSTMQCKLGPNQTALEIAGGVLAVAAVAALLIPGVGEAEAPAAIAAEEAIFGADAAAGGVIEMADLGALAGEEVGAELSVEAVDSEALAEEEAAARFQYPTPEAGEPHYYPTPETEGVPEGEGGAANEAGEGGAATGEARSLEVTARDAASAPTGTKKIAAQYYATNSGFGIVVSAGGIPFPDLEYTAKEIRDGIVTSYVKQVEQKFHSKGLSSGKPTGEVYKSPKQTLSLALTAQATSVHKEADASAVVVKTYSKDVWSGASGSSTTMYHLSEFKTEHTQKIPFTLTVKAFPADVPSVQFKASNKHFPGLSSVNKQYILVMQNDGNLVLYKGKVLTAKNALWSSHTQGNKGAYASMQGDGNFVVYSSAGKALWASGTNSNPGAYLALQDDGKVSVVVGSSLLWSAGGEK